MKPSDFILNSDYLSIAQVSSNTLEVYVGAGSIPVNGYTIQDFNFSVRAQSGAVDRVLIKKDALDYIVCSYMTLTPVWGDESSRVLGFIRVYRTSPDNLKAEVVLENYGNATVSYPAMNFKIKVTSFRPPNVF